MFFPFPLACEDEVALSFVTMPLPDYRGIVIFIIILHLLEEYPALSAISGRFSTTRFPNTVHPQGVDIVVEVIWVCV